MFQAAGLVTSTWNGDNAEVAASVLADDDAFGALVFRLQQASGTEPLGPKKKEASDA